MPVNFQRGIIKDLGWVVQSLIKAARKGFFVDVVSAKR